MKNIKTYENFKNIEVPVGNFKVIPIQRGKYREIISGKNGVFVDQLLSKSFYEGFDKRHDMWTDAIINQLTPETKSYLLQLKNILEKDNNIYTTGFEEEFKRLPKNVDEEIKLISANHWGGYGRAASPQSNVTSLPIPNNSVIQNLMSVTMSSNQKNELTDLYKELFSQ